MPSGAQIASHTAPASQNGQTGRCSVGGGTPATSAISATSSFSVVTSAAGEDVGAVGGRRMLAAQPKAFDQIVDVGQMVVDFAAAEGRNQRPRATPRNSFSSRRSPGP